MASQTGLIFLTMWGAVIEPLGAITAQANNSGAIIMPLGDSDCWKKLPPVESGSGQRLPSWARILAKSLPRTTAALLELDFAQRTKSPLDPKIRAAMRWVAAHANRCAYGEVYAAADARRAGLSDGAVAALNKGDMSGFSLAEKGALEFARKMTVESSAVTDEEFAALVASFGEKKVAAMVLLMAYANFQDRLLICLGAPVEEGGPMPPVEVSFKTEVLSTRSNPAAPPVIPPLAKPTGRDVVSDDSEWSSQSYDQLQKKLEAQRNKPTRLRVPTWDQVKAGLPKGVTTKGTRVVWSLVAFGYVPELAAPWEAVMWINGEENGRRFDRVFGLSLFWVVTRAIDCPYCMGHCEMNWEVIGMSPAQIAERSRVLSGDDWSSFDPKEQRALAFARKLTREPGGITADDVRAVEKDFGLDPCAQYAYLHVALQLHGSRLEWVPTHAGAKQRFLRLLQHQAACVLRGADAAARRTALRPTAKRRGVLEEAAAGCVGRRPAAAELGESGSGTIAPDRCGDAPTRFRSEDEEPARSCSCAKMRWVVAKENHSPYAEATALADLKRGGMDESGIKNLTGDPLHWREVDQEPLQFAKLLTVAAPTIPDELFVRLVQCFGEKKVAAMVLLAAYGNFQDRILLGLNVPLETVGPLSPLDVQFVPAAFQLVPIMPKQKEAPRLLDSGTTVVERDPEWSELPYECFSLGLRVRGDVSPDYAFLHGTK